MADLSQSPGGGQMPYVEPIPWSSFLGAGTFSGINDAILVAVRVPIAMKISSLTCFIGTASGNIDMGVYLWDGASTFTRLASTGSTAASGSAATQTAALSAPVWLMPGTTYHFALAVDNGTVQVSRILPHSSIAGNASRCVKKASSFPLPATISSPAGVAYAPYLMGS